VLEFLQDQFSARLSWRCTWWPIAAYHAPLVGESLRPVSHVRVPVLDFAMVLEGLWAYWNSRRELSDSEWLMVKSFQLPRLCYVPKFPPNFDWYPCKDFVLLDVYAHIAALWRKSDQLFVCFGSPKKGSPVTRQTMSKWIVKAISLAHEVCGQPSPMTVRAHSIMWMGASIALWSGLSLQEEWDEAGCTSPHTFMRFYDLDMGSTSMSTGCSCSVLA